MAKPILIVRFDFPSFTEQQRNGFKNQIELLGIDKEYHVLYTSVGAPANDFSFEVHGSVNNSVPSDFGDIKVKVTGRDIPFSRT